jgi:hypothetical protein
VTFPDELTSKFEAFKPLLTAVGREGLAQVIRVYREKYGENWFAEYKARNADTAEIVDLICNNDFPAALDGLLQKTEVWIEGIENHWSRAGVRLTIKLYLDGMKPDLEKLHTVIRAEIDRPRFDTQGVTTNG